MKLFCSVKGFLLFTALVLIVQSGAYAHTSIRSSTPANKAELTESPKDLKLEFASPVRLLKLSLLNAQQEAVDIDFAPDAEAQKIFIKELPSLDNGSYIVEWSALGHDGHKMTSKFSFSVNAQP